MATAYCLDSNILIYAFSKSTRDAAKAGTARQWIAREDWGATVQVLQEFYVNAIRTPHGLAHNEAHAMIEEIASSRPVISIDVALMRLALQIKNRYGVSYGDAAIIAGARRLGAGVLVSEDLSHGQDYGGVRVLNPFAAM
jgi:predicted nucleic acid-binding protein